MGLFFEVLVMCAVTWWMGESAFRSWLQSRSALGAHDAGVWVNETTWTQIVADLEGESGKSDRGRDPRQRE